jgi:hypothetical protein
MVGSELDGATGSDWPYPGVSGEMARQHPHQRHQLGRATGRLVQQHHRGPVAGRPEMHLAFADARKAAPDHGYVVHAGQPPRMRQL